MVAAKAKEQWEAGSFLVDDLEQARTRLTPAPEPTATDMKPATLQLALKDTARRGGSPRRQTAVRPASAAMVAPVM